VIHGLAWSLPGGTTPRHLPSLPAVADRRRILSGGVRPPGSGGGRRHPVSFSRLSSPRLQTTGCVRAVFVRLTGEIEVGVAQCFNATCSCQWNAFAAACFILSFRYSKFGTWFSYSAVFTALCPRVNTGFWSGLSAQEFSRNAHRNRAPGGFIRRYGGDTYRSRRGRRTVSGVAAWGWRLCGHSGQARQQVDFDSVGGVRMSRTSRERKADACIGQGKTPAWQR